MPTSELRSRLVQLAKTADAIELELAATAAYLAVSGDERPWEETARRKPDKAQEDRLERAKSLYRTLQSMQTPRPLPMLS